LGARRIRTRGLSDCIVRAAGETVSTQENIQDRLELDEGDPGFQLLTEEEIAAIIYFYIYFHQHYLNY
jgi:hypothetical protein